MNLFMSLPLLLYTSYLHMFTHLSRGAFVGGQNRAKDAKIDVS